MFNISLNGEQQSLQEPTSLQQAIEQWQPKHPFAIAINGDFVPRSQYPHRALNADDNIDIVHPVAGG